MKANRTRGARGISDLNRTLDESPRHCLASLGNPERKNTPCIYDLAGVNFLLKKERVFFFRGSALQVFGQCGEAKCGLGFAKTIFWGKDLAKPRLIFVFAFARAEEGSGEESARAFWNFYSGERT